MIYSVCLRKTRCINFHLTSLSPVSFQTAKRRLSWQPPLESVLQTQTGIFKTLSESAPVGHVQNLVLKLHDVTGLPWWATVICTTVMMRSLVTVPLAVYQYQIIGKVQNIQLELAEIAKELKKETAVAVKMFNWDEKTAKHNFKRSLKKQWNLLVVRENCHPAKASLLIWFQIPMWICLSTAFRNLVYKLPHQDLEAHNTFTELAEGGFSWISNLTVIDPYFILPVTLGLINLTIVEVQALSRKNDPTRLQRYALNFFRGFSIFMIPVTACVPSVRFETLNTLFERCLALYWTTSSAYGLLQNVVLMSPKVRRFCRIPETSTELKNPYTHIFSRFKERLTVIPKT